MLTHSTALSSSVWEGKMVWPGLSRIRNVDGKSSLPYRGAVQCCKRHQNRTDALGLKSAWMRSAAIFPSCFHDSQKDVSGCLPVVKFNVISWGCNWRLSYHPVCPPVSVSVWLSFFLDSCLFSGCCIGQGTEQRLVFSESSGLLYRTGYRAPAGILWIICVSYVFTES